jgi:hypothetical protein
VRIDRSIDSSLERRRASESRLPRVIDRVACDAPFTPYDATRRDVSGTLKFAISSRGGNANLSERRDETRRINERSAVKRIENLRAEGELAKSQNDTTPSYAMLKKIFFNCRFTD